MDGVRFQQRSRAAAAARSIFFILVLGGGGWFFYANAGRLKEIIAPPAPCSSPIRYSIVGVDPRFGVSTSTLLSDIASATGMWNAAAGKALFAYDPGGPLKISLVYDYRQAANDELKKLGYSITKDRESFDALSAKYAAEKAKYDAKKDDLETLEARYKRDASAYNANAAAANARGGAKPGELRALEAEKAALDAEVARVRAAQLEVNAFVESLNAMGRVLIRQADALNIKIDRTNDVTDSLGREYEEGLYTSDERGTAITISSFDSEKDLVSILAHEFGHALGLDHVEDPNAVMYYLNRSQEALSESDIAATRAVCRMGG